MQEVLFKLGLFGEGTPDRQASERVLRALLDALLIADIEYLRANPNTPRIYQAGVVYRREPLLDELAKMYPECMTSCRPPVHPEEWKSIPYCIKDGHGDCEDLASWCCAERIVYDGLDAKTEFSFRELGKMLIYHIYVRLPDGQIEDPSLKLGMRRS